MSPTDRGTVGRVAPRRAPRVAARWPALGVAGVLIALNLVAAATTAQATTQVGFKDHSYAGFDAEKTGGAITGQKPESKLWYNAASWWAAMLSPAAAGAHTIWRLDG